MRRFGQITRLAPGKEDEYRALHAEAWPGVLEALTAYGIRNYSIFEHERMLFAYFEYDGEDWESDQARLAADKVVQEWWTLTDACQVRPIDDGSPRPWITIREIFHHA